MFQCIECNYQGYRFNIKIAGIKHGHLVYEPVCPSCGDDKVTVIGEFKKVDLAIGFKPESMLQKSARYELSVVNIINNQNN